VGRAANEAKTTPFDHGTRRQGLPLRARVRARRKGIRTNSLKYPDSGFEKQQNKGRVGQVGTASGIGEFRNVKRVE